MLSLEAGWRCTTIANGEQSAIIFGPFLKPILLLVDKWDFWVYVMLPLPIEHLLRASGWRMWIAVGQSCGLLTASMLLGMATVPTEMLELFVYMVSWDGSCLHKNVSISYIIVEILMMLCSPVDP